MSRKRWYIGHSKGNRKAAFLSATEPTSATHGHIYFACTGPFRDGRAARWAATHGGWSTTTEANQRSRA